MRFLVFDIDGTLLDSQNLLVAAQEATFAAHGLPAPSREEVLSVVGLSLAETFRALAGPDGPHAALEATYRMTFPRLLAEPALASPLFAGSDALVRDLAGREDHLLGIATGKSRRGVRRLFDAHGWHTLFASVQTADDAPSKPHPAMLEQAMGEVGAAPAETVMIGDSTYDMQMARAAGCRAVGVGWGYCRVDALREAGAQVIVESIEELAAVLAHSDSARAFGAAV
ncbi:haloacid dehalogenase superfamily, subfamily IA, variant 3 with third motif having DD or ED/haloacid dehalogenase superfamily, subfamily IA, variant 1 with third motif having Dx(3-4)D or Dx(3-4)E [Chelatococcus sambhunathii]|uniref:Haloacid dehalogenase superfamily, subfamily IA, variant 3 with third motif having DD or ED/haloacid dehalogenase superfamily, subfamily IA, variant 1 with third motif having Dx(3-4)D or Dx(3-4)E n=1 Tax=Chelatococcus sambhunathii TaxID=363953 RepID=A0ABP1ZZN5_9HYPH|nr:HAD-IA family hydrolase [Chelatococcus sambhunathii]CUA85348.1 haloacid dehalogenase superfamily, subfamily IA, variant 3 with third motif having DD or ED/haloacid dehalogenase superfamily, subfamily IA, variant 1 with third motif having Dx(3-4)D or Dx(3-4)E [Chelatococcus sambhunathii]